jgi:hypothetical protein
MALEEANLCAGHSGIDQSEAAHLWRQYSSLDNTITKDNDGIGCVLDCCLNYKKLGRLSSI